jgi:hypothetical protein
MTFLRCLLVSALLLVVPSRAEQVAVFLAAGQSNATPPWAEGIRQVLQESGRYPRLELVRSEHAGNALFGWFDGGSPCPNYAGDLAALRQAMDAIRAAGDTPVFRGLFWMQGEGDCKRDINVELYPSRFNGMMEQYCSDLHLPDAPRFALGITDASPDPVWDNPAFLLTTRERIEALRAQQVLIGGQTNGVAVDSRGLARGDAFHLLWPETEKLGKRMAEAWLDKFPPLPEAQATAAEEDTAAKSFQKADRDRDGQITRGEFRTLMKSAQKIRALRLRLRGGASAAVEAACNVVFNWFDEDQTGTLDREEWLAGNVYDPAVSAPAFHRFPASLTDRNRDGLHSYKEFAWILGSLVSAERCEEWYQAL